MGPLDWKSRTLTTRQPGWVSCGPSLLLFFYTGRLIRALPHLQTLNLTYCSKPSLLLPFCFLFNFMRATDLILKGGPQTPGLKDPTSLLGSL